MRRIIILFVLLLAACSGGGGSGAPVSPVTPTPSIKSMEIIDFQIGISGMYIELQGASFKNTGDVDVDNLRMIFDVTTCLDPPNSRSMFSFEDISLAVGQTFSTPADNVWVETRDDCLEQDGTYVIIMHLLDSSGDIDLSLEKSLEVI